ncbi:MAG: hypothetical protein MZW92_10745 [Comamonadaceae bacterium]|nr:hypothetical protein [Comamonadaceae bacterium]
MRLVAPARRDRRSRPRRDGNPEEGTATVGATACRRARRTPIAAAASPDAVPALGTSGR